MKVWEATTYLLWSEPQQWVNRLGWTGMSEGQRHPWRKNVHLTTHEELLAKWGKNQERRKEGQSLRSKHLGRLWVSEPEVVSASSEYFVCIPFFVLVTKKLRDLWHAPSNCTNCTVTLKSLCSLILSLVLFLWLFPSHSITYFLIAFLCMTLNPEMEGK